MQRAKEFKKPMNLCFIDLQKAYDIVNRDALWEILSKSFSLPGKIIRILKALHSCTTEVIRVDGQLFEEFPISVGVKYGYMLAPTLFNTYLDAVIRVALKKHPNKGIRIEYSHNAPLMHNSRYKLEEATTVQSLAYADDIMITSDKIKDLECLVTSIDDVCNKFGLRINFSKTKYMTILLNNSSPSHNTTLAIRDDINIEQVTQFKYLCSILNSDNTVDAEVESRINKASQVFRSLSRLVWYQRKIKVSTKLKLFKAIIIPTLLYGSETWNVLQSHIQRLQVFTNRCLRIIRGTSLWDKLRNTHVHSRSSSFQFQHSGCNKIAVNKAGLINHIHQIHNATTLHHCPICNKVFQKQGLHNHVKKCSRSQSSVHLLSSG